MENKLPVTQCQYCGSRDIGEVWQHGEALVTFRKRGLSGNRLRYSPLYGTPPSVE